MGTEASADAIVPGRAGPGRAEFLSAGRQTGGLGGRGATGRHDGPALAVRGEGRGAPLGRRRGRKPICAHRGAASVVGVGRESSPGAEVSSATALRRTAGYETRTSGGGRGARAPLLPDFRREFQHHRGDRGRDLVQVVPAAQSKPVEQHRYDSDRLLEVDPGPWLAIEPAIQSSALIRT